MVSSACDVLLSEPERFVPYILGSKKLRTSVYNEDTFAQVIEQVFASDPTLSNIMSQMRSSGDDVSGCLSNVYNSASVQTLIQRNLSRKTQELRQRVKSQHPTYNRTQVRRETNRRLKISIGVTNIRVPTTKQVTIAEALKPIRVKTASGGVYNRSVARPLTVKEKLFIENRLNLKPSELVKSYYDSGLKYRSESSIKTFQSRLRKGKP